MSPSSVGPGSTMARQAVDASSSKRAAQGLAGPLVAGIAVVVGTLAVGEQTSWRFTGWGADPVGHYSLAYWFAHHWTLPAADDLTWHIIADNPPAAYIAAAVVGHVVGSTFMGMYLVASAAVVLVWCALAALLALLPAPAAVARPRGADAAPRAQHLRRAATSRRPWLRDRHQLLLRADRGAGGGLVARLVRGHSQAERAVGCFDRRADRDPGRSLDLRPWIGVGRVTRTRRLPRDRRECRAVAQRPTRAHVRGAAARALPRDGGRDLRHAAVPRPAGLCAQRRLPRGGLPHLAVRLCDGRTPGRRRLRDISPRLDQGTARSRDGGRSPGSCLRGHRDRRTILCPAGTAPGGRGLAVCGQEVHVRPDHTPRGGSVRPRRQPRPTISTPAPRADGAELRLRRRARRRCDIRDILATRPRLLHDARWSTSSAESKPSRRPATSATIGGTMPSSWSAQTSGSTTCSRPQSYGRSDRGPLDLHYLGKSGALLRSADQLVTSVGTRYDQAACRSSAPRDALVVVGAECLAGDSP